MEHINAGTTICGVGFESGSGAPDDTNSNDNDYWPGEKIIWQDTNADTESGVYEKMLFESVNPWAKIASGVFYS